MAIYTYTNNGITFNRLDSAPSPRKEIPGKIFSGENDFEYAAEDGIKPVVNAVEIDWNGAQVQLSGENSSRTINTTGELMNLIKEVSSPMLAN